MKIAMVSEHASPLAVMGGVDAGGQNVHVEALAQALARRGHEVTISTRRDDADAPDRVELSPGVVVEHLDAGPASYVPKDELLPLVPQMARDLADRWESSRPDVVHAHFWMSGLASMPGCRDLEVPLVQTFHALGAVKRRHQGDKDTSPQSRVRLERALARGVNHVMATCSDEVFELLRMGAERQSVSVVPCGVDTTRFTAAGPVAPRGSRPRLLVVGRLVERKGVDTAIAALRGVPWAELVVAGGPAREHLGTDPEAQRLLAMARELGVADRVELLGGVAREELPALLRSADAVVCVPWYEPFGMVPLEAMACGVPVVASAVGGLVDTVVDGTTGALVPPRRPDVLAQVLRGLLQDPVRLKAYGRSGADRVQARYTWDRIAADTEAVYRRLMVAGPRAAVGEGVPEAGLRAGLESGLESGLGLGKNKTTHRVDLTGARTLTGAGS